MSAARKKKTGPNPYPKAELLKKGKQRSFTGQYLDQVAFPLGGLGAGQVNLGGSGNFLDFSIFNKPSIGEHPTTFATIYAKAAGDESVTRVIEGPVTHSRIFNGGREGNGVGVGHEGFPHMSKATFRGEFPFANIDFADPDLPLKVSLEAFSPFIPLDVKNSAIPGGILQYSFKNTTKKTVSAQFAFNMASPFGRKSGFFVSTAGCTASGKRSGGVTGVVYANLSCPPGHNAHGDVSIVIDDPKTIVKETWAQGGAADHKFLLWKELSAGDLQPLKCAKAKRPGEFPPTSMGSSIGLSFRLKPGETKTIPLILSWYFAEAGYHALVPKEDIEKAEREDCGCEGGDCSTSKRPDGVQPKGLRWSPYYAGVWKDSFDVGRYLAKNLESLERRTRRYKEVFFGSTFPALVLDAVSANLGILKSPTCLLLKGGQFWTYEGCTPGGGCCGGSCTHVWNYAQAVPHLFPSLERTLRTLELENSMRENGHVCFRSRLPVGPSAHSFPAASDGQLGGIMKVFRDWQISGDDDWLRRLYPLAKKSVNYCIETWDPDEKGALFEMHHNTYDIEFWGPDGMCTSFYLGALRAMVEMAAYLGIDADAKRYGNLANRGMEFCNKELFNGEYYGQKIMWTGLRHNMRDTAWWPNLTSAVRKVCAEEGPRYQYGDGCLSDGVIGQWFTEMMGIPDALDHKRTHKNLESIFKYNFKPNMRKHANPTRPTYALNDEAGLILCTWPRGGQLSLPFHYATEVWTGIEYQVASHMIYHGLVDEALSIIKGVRDRHDGFRRNPWNEYECGNYYARALSVYGVFTALSGFRYSAVEQKVHLAPQLDDAKMKTFFSTDKGWGSLTLSRTKKSTSVKFEVEEGKLTICQIELPKPAGKVSVCTFDGANAKACCATNGDKILITLSRPVTVKPGVPVTVAVV